MTAELPARPFTSWRPLRVYSYSAPLECTTRTVYGYRAECRCGWLGLARRGLWQVREDMREHECQTTA